MCLSTQSSPHCALISSTALLWLDLHSGGSGRVSWAHPSRSALWYIKPHVYTYIVISAPYNILVVNWEGHEVCSIAGSPGYLSPVAALEVVPGESFLMTQKIVSLKAIPQEAFRICTSGRLLILHKCEVSSKQVDLTYPNRERLLFSHSCITSKAYYGKRDNPALR